VTRHTILVPVDFSEHSKAAMRRALHLSRILDHDLALLHVVDASRPRAGTVEAARERLLALAAEADPERTCVKIVSVLEGRPHDVILHVANTISPQMIVMGKRGDGSIGMGSVAERIVRGASCDVLVVRDLEPPAPLAPGQEE
jgi:nucleotide-binding universal stress UspA family protein